MIKDRQRALAERFRLMHRAPPALLLPNAWDAMSARLFEAAGFGAIGTTSGGLAWALGRTDGEAAPWDEVVAATGRIVRAVRVPVTADIEGGYGATPDEVAKSVEDILRVGAVGINLEDSTPEAGHPMRPLEEAADRLRAAREAASSAGIPLVINARIDLYLTQTGNEVTRFDETVRRARAYLAAGADCVFPLGLTDPERLSELVMAVGAPVNAVGRAGGPSLAELERAGVARVSTAGGPALMALSLTRKIAEELRATGGFDMLTPAVTRAEAQALFAPRPD